ncbi:MAG: GNAT family N-acetyltransferase [Bacteroidia bacterium]|nr:GNAT family N-acetyltransferase [Bacteroidia bacterium]NNM23755.1 GNAT family N-acetyltransferase [Flavobacteriaceae bacterium]
MNQANFIVRNARPEEFSKLGSLMVAVYSELAGFPSPEEQPNYYDLLRNIGKFTEKPNTELLVAVNEFSELGGGLVYFSDMKYYGSGGIAPQQKNASGFRLLAIDPKFRGKGLAKLLTQECIDRAQEDGNSEVIIHTTGAMQIAWKMYEKFGFERSPDLDFLQQDLPVYGFRLKLG